MAERDSYFGTNTRYRLFQAIKYLVYLLLSLNVYLFLQEEITALSFTFTDGVGLGQVIQAFSATIDTGAWVILLLMFELETAVLDDDNIHGPVKWGLHGLRGLCYIAIVYAFTGYYQELATLYQVSPLLPADACALLGTDYSLLVDLDEYVPMDAANCAALVPPVYTLDGFDIVADEATLQAAQWLAWVDVINSADWILVVAILEIEVRLQLRGALTDRVMQVTKFIKLLLYTILFACAAYWGYAGDFLDFWDASLWLFAFIFIELNVFEWQYESDHKQAAAA
jgi:hypothetical protein